jgi:hypothetical protein
VTEITVVDVATGGVTVTGVATAGVTVVEVTDVAIAGMATIGVAAASVAVVIGEAAVGNWKCTGQFCGGFGESRGPI